MKLSSTQLKVLRWLSVPGEKAYFISGLNAYWFLGSTWKTLRYATMAKLISIGLVKPEFTLMGDYKTATITQAGHELLKTAGKDDEL